MSGELERIEARLTSVEARLGHMETQDAVASAHYESVKTRLDQIEGSLQWLVRLILGSLLLAALAFFVNGGLSLAQ